MERKWAERKKQEYLITIFFTEKEWVADRTLQFSSVQSLSRIWLFVTPWTAAHQASLSITNSQSLLKLMYIKSVMPDAGKDWGQEEKGTTEDEMAGWHHPLNGHEFEQTLGDSEGQGSLARCSPWGHKQSDTTERPNKDSTWPVLAWVLWPWTFSESQQPPWSHIQIKDIPPRHTVGFPKGARLWSACLLPYGNCLW